MGDNDGNQPAAQPGGEPQPRPDLEPGPAERPGWLQSSEVKAKEPPGESRKLG